MQQLEDQLDVGNIIVARNEAELRVSKPAMNLLLSSTCIFSNYRQEKLPNNVQQRLKRLVGGSAGSQQL